MAHVLVIDDDPLFREIAREMLAQAGYDVTLAADGGKASRMQIERQPDLAVVDMLMPERDGIETIGDLQARWPTVKVIAVSSGARGPGGRPPFARRQGARGGRHPRQAAGAGRVP